MNNFFPLLAGMLLLGKVCAAGTMVNNNPTQDAFKPSLALDLQGRPIVAWVEQTGGVARVFAKRWEDDRWQPLGNALNHEQSQNAAYTALAVNSQGQPVVAWTEKNNDSQGKLTGSGKLYVARWDGQRWKTFGNSPSLSPGTVSDIPRLALDRQGNPYLQWSEMPPDFNGDSVYVSRWNGRKWQVIDRGSLSSDISSSSRSRAIVVNTQNQPILAWSVQLYEAGVGSLGFAVYAGTWNGKNWVPWGGMLSSRKDYYAAGPSIALDAQDRPVVAWHESGGGKGYNVYVKRWNGKSWVPYGQSVNAMSGGASLPVLRLDPKGNPVVGYLENQGSIKVAVRRWNGQGWVPLGGYLGSEKSNVDSFAMVLDKNGNPYVVWAEGSFRSASGVESGGPRKVYIARWDGTAWVGL